MNFDLDTVICGAGVIGLAIARTLAASGRDVILLDAADAFGTQTSARNSEVIHAGIYYQPGSLKAQLCVRGKALLYAYCDQHNVEYKRCGKLIVATTVEQQQQLESIRQRAIENGVHDLQMLDAAAVGEMEPALNTIAALHSPSTGIIDSHQFMLSLVGETESHGGMIAFNSPVQTIDARDDGFVISCADADATQLRCREIINTAGHGACRLASSINGLDARHVPTPLYSKGNYFSLRGTSPVSRLVYPVPEPGGLGVHITMDLHGQVRFGPDVEWIDTLDYPVDANRAESFYERIRQYWPALPDHALTADYAGIRPKISCSGKLMEDFVIQGVEQHGIAGLVNLFGIESPGLTASLAIAEQVAAKLGAQCARGVRRYL